MQRDIQINVLEIITWSLIILGIIISQIKRTNIVYYMLISKYQEQKITYEFICKNDRVATLVTLYLTV